MRIISASLLLLFLISASSCKKNNDTMPDTSSTKISIKDSAGRAGDILIVTGHNFNGQDKKIFFNTVEAVIKSSNDSVMNVIIPNSTSGTLLISVGKNTSNFNFHYSNIDCSYIKQLSISNFKVTKITSSGIEYSFDLTNNSNAYIDFKDRTVGSDVLWLQNYVSSDASGTTKIPAGGTNLPIISGVNDVMSPREVFNITYSAVGANTYLFVHLKGEVGKKECTDELVFKIKVK